MFRPLIAGTVLLALAGCGGSGRIGEDQLATHVRVLNVMADSPSLQFRMGETVIGTVGFGGGTAYGAAPAQSHSVGLRAVRPGRLPGSTGSTDPIVVGQDFDRNFSADIDYTLVAAGTMANPHVIVLEAADNDLAEVPATKLIWRMVHAAPGGPTVDVYLTAPEAGIAAPQYIATLGFPTATTKQELTLTRQPGEEENSALFVNMTFELRETGTGTVLYNSGALGFTERNRLLFAITPNAGALGASPFQLTSLAFDSSGALLRDPSDPAAVRLVHLSPGSPDLDLWRVASPSQALAQNVAFGDFSARAVIPNGSVDLFGAAAGNPGEVAFVTQFNAIRAQPYSILAIGAPGAVDELLLGDDRRPAPTQARFRFVHAAPSLSDTAVDVYLTLPGKAIDFNPDDDTDTTDDAANLRQNSAIPFRSVGGYITLEGGTYDVYFARAGENTTLVGPIPHDFPNGSVQTVALIDTLMGTLAVHAVDDTM